MAGDQKNWTFNTGNIEQVKEALTNYLSYRCRSAFLQDVHPVVIVIQIYAVFLFLFFSPPAPYNHFIM